jgi:hypothetical protein
VKLPTNRFTLALPSAPAAAIGTAITGAIAVTEELQLSTPVHRLIVIAGALVLAFVVRPEGRP